MPDKLKNIAEQYISSFPLSEEPQKEEQPAVKIFLKYFHFTTQEKISLSQREQVALCFKKLTPSHTLQRNLNQETLLEDYTHRDLDLITGQKESPAKNVLNYIKRTKTNVGGCVMASQLVTPPTDTLLVEQKQTTTKYLLNNPQLKNSLEKQFNTIQANESACTLLWSKQRPTQNKELKKVLDKNFAQLGLLWRPNHKSPIQLSLLRCIKDFLFGWAALLPMMIMGVLGAALIIMKVGLIAKLSKLTPILAFSVLSRLLSLLYLSGLGIARLLSRRSLFRTYVDEFAPLQTYIKAAHAISQLIKKDFTLERLYGKHLTQIRKLLDKLPKSSEKGRMVHYLKTLPLQNFYYFWHSAGSVITLHTLFNEHKNELADLFYEVGQLDAQLSIVRLLRESQASQAPNTYTFSAIRTKGTHGPYIQAKALWHPVLDSHQAVANDLIMDAQRIRMLIITGPNTGGKSTYILASGINLILSQAFGIAAAQSFEHACFTKLITYVNPIQNIAEGRSLAEAGFQVLTQHKQLLETTQGYVFAIIDEILNGVDPDVAAELSYEILEARHKKYPNCLTMLTTHYKHLTKLDKLPYVTNKKVEVIIPGEYSPFDCTFKIVDGISQQNIVRLLLEHKGVLDGLK